MKTNFKNFGVFGCIAATIFLTACDKPTTQVEPLLTASKAMQKIETAYYEGAEKIETSGGTKDLQTNADQLFIDDIVRTGTDQYIKFNSRYIGAKDISGGYDVGVIPTNQSCPLTSELVKISVDNEDKDTRTVENDTPGNDWNSSWEVVAGGNTDLYFCKIDGRLLSNSGGKFAVLKLGNTKPSNVKSVNYLHLDCEDRRGNTRFIRTGDQVDDNEAARNAMPNSVDGSRNLSLYWYVFDNSGSGAFPNLSFEYGVLGNPANAISRSEYYTDDEDTNNTNAMSTLEGTPDITSIYSPGVWGINSAGQIVWLVYPYYYEQTATGYKFIGGSSAGATSDGARQGTRFFLARVN